MVKCIDCKCIIKQKTGYYTTANGEICVKCYESKNYPSEYRKHVLAEEDAKGNAKIIRDS